MDTLETFGEKGREVIVFSARKDPRIVVRVNAVEWLGVPAIANADWAVALLRESLDDPEPAVRMMAVRRLFESRKVSDDDIRKAWADPDKGVRDLAVVLRFPTPR